MNEVGGACSSLFFGEKIGCPNRFDYPMAVKRVKAVVARRIVIREGEGERGGEEWCLLTKTMHVRAGSLMMI